jgi:hypothetical protein
MYIAELINHSIPRLQLVDTVGKARRLITDFKLTHLPIVSENIFLGLISEEDLLDVEDEKTTIELIQKHFIQVAVQEEVHFLNAINISNQFDTNIVPVINKLNIYKGVITRTDLLKTIGNFAGANELGGIIVLEMNIAQFAISEISRIVESNNCTILHLNTTHDASNGLFTVTIHLNKREVAAIVATFERYDYTVLNYFGHERFENGIDDNYKNLMNYLNI